MTPLRRSLLVLVLAAALAGLRAGDAATSVGTGAGDGIGRPLRAHFVEVKWPFRLDEWGVGRAFRCDVAACGVEAMLLVRVKIGFCNCEDGVSDDAELDRVGDLALLSEKFVGLAGGRPIEVGWMHGRSRPYLIDMPYSSPRIAQAIAFNQQCDVIVATVLADRAGRAAAERLALASLKGDMMLRWAKAELG